MHTGFLTLLGAISAATALELDLDVTPRGRSLLEITFKELSFPTGLERHYVRSSKSAVVDGKKYHTKYNVLARSGDKVGDYIFGQLVDEHYKGIEKDGVPYVSNYTDFTSYVPHGDHISMVHHFESPNPSCSYLSYAKQDKHTGKLDIEWSRPMDWSKFGGLWTPCAGSVSPWKSHLGSEEYEPNDRAIRDAIKANATGQEWADILTGRNLYVGLPDTAGNKEVAAKQPPYLFGYPWEVKTDASGEIVYQKKHYAAGRHSIELPYVMPDWKTMYLTDDGDGTMFSVYVASKAGDLDCGTIYGAKMTQKEGGMNGGYFDVEWIQIGPEACSHEFEHKVREYTFYDLFEAAEPDAKSKKCPHGYTSINQYGIGQECLKLKKGMYKYASRFETRRMGAMLGCTTEFSKWEGITYDTKRNKLFTSMSEVRRGMEDFGDEGEASGEFDDGGPNDVRLPYIACGCVYALDVDPKTYLATNFYGFICGDQKANTDDNNSCNKDNISSPDNIVYVSGHDGLVIGEDTDYHQNDAVWYYDFKTKELTRFLTSPYGSEWTSPYWYPNINGFAYLEAVVQHPYGESDEDKIDEPQSTGMGSYVGYMGPFKAHKGSVDEDASGPSHGKFWNDFPVSAYYKHGRKHGGHKKHHKKHHEKDCKGKKHK